MFLRDILTETIKNAILAPLIDCQGSGRTVSGESYFLSGSFHTAEQFPIDGVFNAIYSKAKSR